MKQKSKNKPQATGSIEEEFTLRPWREVARLFNERSGEHITRGGAWVIGKRAIRKLREAMEKPQ